MVLTTSNLLVDSHHGIYIPQVFTEQYPALLKHLKVPHKDVEILRDPEHPEHDDAWSELLDCHNGYTDEHGREWLIEQIDGDVFANLYTEPDGYCCSDCIQVIANGEWPPEAPRWKHNADIPNEWCLLCDVGDGSATDEFSRCACDTCGDDLAGTRHALSFVPRRHD